MKGEIAMPRKKPDPLKALLARVAPIPDCRDARIAWTRETGAALRKAQRAMDERLGDAVTRLSATEFERLFDEEQAKVDALLTPMQRVAEEDRWPRHLHVSGL